METMKNMTPMSMAKAVGGRLVGAGHLTEAEITGVTIDSRKITENCLFVALPGERVDGHRFITQAIRDGAMLALAEQEQDASCPCILVESTRTALRKLAEYYLKQVNIPVVGITGSVGKTSTKEMIAAVLAKQFLVHKTEGNFNNEIGLPLTVFGIRPEHEIAVLEMGISDFGEMSRLARIARPDVCVITNIGTCHLENLGDRDGVFRAKTEAFEYLKEGGLAILNGDDDKLRQVKTVKGKKPVFFGLGSQPEERQESRGFQNDAEKRDLSEPGDRKESAEKKACAGDMTNIDVTAMDIVSHGLYGTDFTLKIHDPEGIRLTAESSGTEEEQLTAESSMPKGRRVSDGLSTPEKVPGSPEYHLQNRSGEADGSVRVHLAIPGEHMVADALAAAAVGIAFGIPLKKIALGLEQARQVGGRQRMIQTDTCTVIDDCYNANPMSMEAALKLLSQSTENQQSRRVAILGDMFELGADEETLHYNTGVCAAKCGIELLIFIGELAAWMKRGAEEEMETVSFGAQNPQIVYYPTVEEALFSVKSLLKPGDLVLIKASHGMAFERIVRELAGEQVDPRRER